jgi:hypothetical protein
MLENGNLKYAEAYLNYRSQKNKEKQLQLQRENMMIDKQRELEGIQLKHSLEIEKMVKETDEKLRYKEGELKLEEEYKVNEHYRDIEKSAIDTTIGAVAKTAETPASQPSA